MRAAPLLLQDFLLDAAERLPEKVALVCSAQHLTYKALDRQSNALAHGLIEDGVQRGDRVLLFAYNSIEAVISFWAVLKANAVVSIINPMTKSDKFAYYLNNFRATALITENRLIDVAQAATIQSPHLKAVIVLGCTEIPHKQQFPHFSRFEDARINTSWQTPPDRLCLDIDLAAIIYTSGSTGEPKGVMLTHRNMIAASSSITTYLGNVEDDVILNVLPLSFDYGLYQMIMAFQAGARLVLEHAFTVPAQIMARIKQEGVTGFPCVPTMIVMFAEFTKHRKIAPQKIRYVTSSGATLSEKNIHLLAQLFPGAKIYSMYGLTECKRCTYLPPEDIDKKPTSVGIAIPNTELWLVDEHDRRVAPGQVGQLVIRGATVMRGYWDAPEETAKRLKPGPLPGEMVLYTGDLCRQDDAGYLYFIGRMDDIIKSRGQKVAPLEVERALMHIQGVKEAAVIGIPDSIQGHAIKAYVVLEDEAMLSAQAIRNACKRYIEDTRVPKEIQILSKLPKNAVGKVDKQALP